MAFQNQRVVKVKKGTKVKTLDWMLELPWQHKEINVHYVFSGNMDLCKLLKNYLLIFPPLSISTTILNKCDHELLKASIKSK